MAPLRASDDAPNFSVALEAELAIERSFLTAAPDPSAALRQAEQALSAGAATPELASLRAKEQGYRSFLLAVAAKDEARIESTGQPLWRLCSSDKPDWPVVRGRYIKLEAEIDPKLAQRPELIAASLPNAATLFDGSGHIPASHRAAIESLVPPVNRNEAFGSQTVIAVKALASRGTEQWKHDHPGEVPSIETLRAINRQAAESVLGREGTPLYNSMTQQIADAFGLQKAALRNAFGETMSWAPGPLGPGAQLALTDMTSGETKVTYAFLAASIIPGVGWAKKLFRGVEDVLPEANAATSLVRQPGERMIEITAAHSNINHPWGRWGLYPTIANRIGIRKAGQFVFVPKEMSTFNHNLDALKAEGWPCGFRYERYEGGIVPYSEYRDMLMHRRKPIATEYEAHDLGFHAPGDIFTPDRVAQVFEEQSVATKALEGLGITSPLFQKKLAVSVQKVVDGADGFAVTAAAPDNINDIPRLVDNMRRAGIDRSPRAIIDEILAESRSELSAEQIAAIEKIREAAPAAGMSDSELAAAAETILRTKNAAAQGLATPG